MNSGIVKATAATLYVGLGGIPRRLRITNLTDRTSLRWSRDFRAGVLAETHYGISRAAAGDEAAITTAAGGVIPYSGGDKMTAASTAYVVANDKDQRGAYDSNAPISTFTIGSVANLTGNFDVEASTSFVGPGSVIVVGDIETYVVAMTSNGESANETTLAALPTGAVAGASFAVKRLASRYNWTGAGKGVVIPAGICIGASATVNNTDGDILCIEYEM